MARWIGMRGGRAIGGWPDVSLRLLDCYTHVSYGGCHDRSPGANVPDGPGAARQAAPGTRAQADPGWAARGGSGRGDEPADSLGRQADAVAAACHAMAVRF